MTYSLGPGDYDRIFTRDKLTCRYCDLVADSLEIWMQFTIDHIIPKRFKSCTNEDDNLTTCCFYCNTLTNTIPEKDSFTRPEIIEMKRRHVKEIHASISPRYFEIKQKIVSK